MHDQKRPFPRKGLSRPPPDRDIIVNDREQDDEKAGWRRAWLNQNHWANFRVGLMLLAVSQGLPIVWHFLTDILARIQVTILPPKP